MVPPAFIPETRSEMNGSIMVNNAGVSPGKPQWMESFEDFWRTIEINFKSVRIQQNSSILTMTRIHQACVLVYTMS